MVQGAQNTRIVLEPLQAMPSAPNVLISAMAIVAN